MQKLDDLWKSKFVELDDQFHELPLTLIVVVVDFDDRILQFGDDILPDCLNVEADL
jgi:hypothetical protein